MPLSSTQLAALKTELLTDPKNYGYAGQLSPIRNDDKLTQIVNFVRNGVATPPAGNVGPSIKINNATVDTGVLRAATTYAAYNGLTTGDRAFFNWLTGAGSITVNDDNLQTLAGIPITSGSIWATGQRDAMNLAMEAILRRFASRAEELFGRGVVVTTSEVGTALNLP